MVLSGNLSNGNLTSLQSKGACATSLSPLPCVAVKNERKRRFLHRMGTITLFYVNRGMEFILGQKMELIIILKSESKEDLMTS